VSLKFNAACALYVSNVMVTYLGLERDGCDESDDSSNEPDGRLSGRSHIT